MAKSVITLTTDLGLFDHYVGVMKGVIWNINPEVNIVDLSHEINAYDIVEAAFKLECAYRYFPTRSVHVVVVDPGVGSARRPILAVGETSYFVAPDNGVLSWVMKTDEVKNVYEITAKHYFLNSVGNTFHGRDIFAPVAANLSRMIEASNFGDKIENFRRFKLPSPVIAGNTITGKIISIDRFGNCISNILAEDIEKLENPAGKENLTFEISSSTIKGLNDYYAQKETKQPLALIGNAGYLEIAINKGNASKGLKIRKNIDITVKV